MMPPIVALSSLPLLFCRLRRPDALLAIAFLTAAISTASTDDRDSSSSIVTGSPTPVIVVPGISGTQLEDPRNGAIVWGRARQLMRPRDGGYSLALPLDLDHTPPHPQERYQPTGPVWQMNLIFWKKKIYRPLADHLEQAGYRLGSLDDPVLDDSLFFFDYDWRQSTVESALRLAEAVERLNERRGAKQQVDLICQSNAAKICRYLVKYGGATLEEASAGRVSQHAGRHIRKVIMVGASNDGALRILAFLNRGRRYIPLIGRRISQEAFFTLRSLFDDLPAPTDDLFFDTQGQPLEIDLFRTENWVTYGWSVFGTKTRRRLERGVRKDLFGSEDDRLRHLERQLARARRFQDLLSHDSPRFPPVRYYRLENQSEPTMVRALVFQHKSAWKTRFFGDRAVGRKRTLRDLAAAPGDGHASLASQRRLSPQEENALVDAAIIGGGHFEMILEPEGLNAIVSFLVPSLKKRSTSATNAPGCSSIGMWPQSSSTVR